MDTKKIISREFFSLKEMDKESFRELQLKELEILLYFNDFCKENNLRYYLSGGTLIGAVRHKGFIPWDDDIDVHMPRPDYDRLMRIWNNENEKYLLCYSNDEVNFRHHVYTLVDRNSTFIEMRNVGDDIPQGIKIDIMVYDGAPKNKFKRIIQFFWAIIFAIYNVQRLPENQGGKLMSIMIRCMLWLVPGKKARYKIWKYAEKQMKKYNFDDSPFVKELAAPLKSMTYCYPREEFDKSIQIEFEGHLLPVHHYYKEYLSNVYHDYMKLPSEENRIPKSKVAYINLDEPYIKYRGIYYKR